jgi:hypothetical protein
MQEADVEATLKRMFAAGNLHTLSTPEQVYVVERLKSFPIEETTRLVHSYVFGIKPEFLAAMKPEELEAFRRIVEGQLVQLVGLVADVGQRSAFQFINVHIGLLQDKDLVFLYTFMSLLRLKALARALTVGGGAHMSPAWDALSKLDTSSQDEQITEAIGFVWDLCGSDGPHMMEPEHAIAAAKIRGEFPTREQFEQRAWAAFRSNEAFTTAVLQDVDAFLPRQMFVVTDCFGVLSGNKTLRDAFSATLSAMGDAWRKRQKE